MSYRKTRLIQERNLLLERKYILEQAPPLATPPPPAVAPPPIGGTPATGTTSDQTKKFTKEQIDQAPNCSNFKNIKDNPKYEKKELVGKEITYGYYLTEKKDAILCKVEPKKEESK